MLSFYNFDNFEVRKVKLINNDVVMNFQDLKIFSENFLKLKKRLIFKI